MRGFVELMVLLLSDIVTSGQFRLDFSTGVESLKATEGEPATIIFNVSTMEPVHKVTLARKNVTIVCHCSDKEKMSGCKEITSNQISVHIGHGNVSVVFHNVTARDAGGYSFQLVGNGVENRWSSKSFNLTLEPLEMNSSTETPPTTDPPDQNTNVAIWVALVVVLLAAILICCIFRKKLWQIIRSWVQFFRSKLHRHTSVPSTDCKEAAASGDFITTKCNDIV